VHVAVVMLPPCRLGLRKIRQAQFKDTRRAIKVQDI